jgi:cell division septal protein FtsQ
MSDMTQELARATLSKRAYERRRQRVATLQLLRGGAIACFFLCVMLLVAMLHLNRRPVREIVFEGNEHYSVEQLSLIFPQKVGEPLYLIDPEAIRENMLSQCSYLADVDVEVDLGGTVRVTLTERSAQWALRYDTADDTVAYALLDEQLRLLEYTQEIPSACVVICPGIVLPRAGETLPQAAERETQAYVDRMLAEGMKKSQITPPAYETSAEKLGQRLTCIAEGFVFDDGQAAGMPAAVDFSAAYDYTLTLTDGSVLLLGNAQQLTQQISYAITAMQNYRREQGMYASSVALMVDVRDLSRVFVREMGETS